MLRFLTSGESHGKCLVAILEGMVAGLTVHEKDIDFELARRQEGYGRGGRMTIEKDRVEILSGVRSQKSLGGPIALMIPNRDFKINELPVVKRPRPGHADLAGVLKYGRGDVRDILERASARETAARVAAGAVCRIFLKEFGVDIVSHVVSIGGVTADTRGMSFEAVKKESMASPMHCADRAAAKRMMARVDHARTSKDTIGGVFEVIVKGVPVGLGSFVHYDRRLSAKLCAGILSIQAVKGVEIGMGFKVSEVPGKQVHDEIFYDRKKGFYRKTNNAGGFEGGVTNGENLILRAATKPYATLMSPLQSVNIDSKKKGVATVERSDVTAVPACGVVGEAMVAFELANGFLEKFGGDSLKETRRNYDGYRKQVSKF
ncbi:MAG: chorismate synthase [Omnitrophica bacterium RIFCSPHIGHO2_02_FULL_51_18]|nr:MAG: chorismate synthase [Omnitrophica bacterium RIFCSPHIGHO2_02_FULL_51_18]